MRTPYERLGGTERITAIAGDLVDLHPDSFFLYGMNNEIVRV